MTVGTFLLLGIQSLLVAGTWVGLTRARSGHPRQRQVLFVSGFLVLLLSPLLVWLPKLVVMESSGTVSAMFSPTGSEVFWNGRWLQGILFVWLLGCAVFLVGWVEGRYRLQRILARAESLPPDLAGRCYAHVDPEIRMAISEEDLAPCVCGVFRPVLLLPRQALVWRDAELAAVLHHERNHLQRGDLWVRLLADVSCALHWFNPLVRQLRARYFEEAEVDCDRVALRESGIVRGEYAEALLSLAVERRLGIPVIPMADASNSLEGRIREIMSGAEAPTRRGWLPVLVIAVLLFGLLGANAIGIHQNDQAVDAPLEREAALRWMADPFPAD